VPVCVRGSPFLPTTNDGLFNWTRDAAILDPNAVPESVVNAVATVTYTAGVSSKFEFRLRTKVDAAAKALLMPEWRTLIEKSAPAATTAPNTVK